MTTSNEIEVKVGFKPPIVMGSIGLLTLLFLGYLGRDGVVAFEVSRRIDSVQLPTLDIDSSTLGVLSGLAMIAIAGFSLSRAVKNRKTPIWASVVFGAIGVVAGLGWLAAEGSVPIAFIAGTACLAVPIILGAMAGIMSERVGITNIAIEGQLLTGAFMAAVVSSITDNFLFRHNCRDGCLWPCLNDLGCVLD